MTPSMRLDTIVVGVDGGDSALRLTKWLSTFVVPRARLVLVHAIDDAQFGDCATASSKRQGATLLRELQDRAASLGRADVRCVIRAGRPAHVLLDVAAEVGADWLGVGARETDERRWLGLGRTADRVVRHATRPVLIGRAVPEKRPTTLLLGIEDADVTPLVAAWTAYLEGSLGLAVRAVHVVSNAAYSHWASMVAVEARSDEASGRQLRDEIRAEAARWLDFTIREAGGLGPGATCEVLHGPTGREIVDAAARASADLIVLGRHGGSRVLPPRLGRTVASVLHDARCPVLVVSPCSARAGEA